MGIVAWLFGLALGATAVTCSNCVAAGDMVAAWQNAVWMGAELALGIVSAVVASN